MMKSFIPVIVLGAVGCALSAYAYLSNDTGVAGTPGALLALIGAAAVTVGSVIAALTALGRPLFFLLAFLIALAAVLTALAAFFLMQYGLTVVMALAFVGLLVAVLLPAPQRRLI
jgi:drug/metabolite transporter (DMT)-like permease